MEPQFLRNLRHRHSLFQLTVYKREVLFNDFLFGGAALRASQDNAGRLAVGQGFLRALRDEIALNLSGQREREGDDLRVDVAGEVEVVFDGVNPDAALRAGVQHGHYHKHIPSET